MSRLVKKAAGQQCCFCKIDNKELVCEIINPNYSDFQIEVKMLEGSHIGIPAIVENDNVLYKDNPLTTTMELNKNGLFKITSKKSVDRISVNLYNYFDGDIPLSYVEAVVHIDVDDDDTYGEPEVTIGFTSELLTIDSNKDKLRKEQQKLVKKITTWTNGNYDITTEEVDV